MSDITITKLNETWIKVICSDVYMELDIQDRFSFEVPGAKHDPRVKFGKWDGIKKLYNRTTKKMYLGLTLELVSFCQKKGWSVHVDPDLLPSFDDQLTTDDLIALIEEVIKPHGGGQPIEPYDYQLDAVLYAMNMDRSVILAATSAGKSLIQYLLVRLYQLMDDMQGKTIFLCVPSISLVEQMYADFKDYSTFEGSNWHVDRFCQKISSKYDKKVTSPIVITTWQSMIKLPCDVIEQTGMIIVDEVHTAKADVLSGMLESLTNCKYRHGLTGTLNNVECDQLVIQGLLGPAKRIVSANDLIEQGRASDIHITMAMINHSQQTKEQYQTLVTSVPHSRRYNAEVEFLNEHQARRNFILDLVHSLEGNTLVLFDRVENYGQDLYEASKDIEEDRVFMITGSVNSSDREEIRTSMEDHDKAIIWASYGTMSTGVSIKKLHNLVLISSSKSNIRVLQSIGRMMRLHTSKSKANIIDVVDNLTLKDKPNYVMKHAKERLEFYNQECFKIKFEEFTL